MSPVATANLVFGAAAVFLIFSYFTYYLFVGFWLQLEVLPSVIRIPTGIILVWTGVATLAIGARYVVLMLFAYLNQKDLAAPRPEPAEWPSVSILVPAYDESRTIEDALRGLLEIDYPRLEVIVVDDGSKDDTLERIRAFVTGPGAKVRVRAFTKPNGGKSNALNLAFQHATGELCLCVDADSRIGADAVRRLAAWFADGRIAACSGQVRVRNRGSLLTRLQALEYVVGHGIVRNAQAFFRHVLIVPGPIAMFRRSALEALAAEARSFEAVAAPVHGPGHVPGPFESDTLAEDCDATLGLLRAGGQVAYEPLAISYTRSPEHTYTLLNQRYRWSRGVLQASTKQFDRWRREPGRRAGFPLWIGLLLVESLAWPVAELVGLAVMILILLTVGLSGPFLFVLVLLTLVDLNGALFSLIIEDDDLLLAPLVVLQRFYFGPLLALGKVFATVDEALGHRASWS